MKVFSTTAIFALASTRRVLAGGMAEPVMDAQVVEAATSSASQHIIILLHLLPLIIAAATAPDAPVT